MEHDTAKNLRFLLTLTGASVLAAVAAWALIDNAIVYLLIVCLCLIAAITFGSAAPMATRMFRRRRSLRQQAEAKAITDATVDSVGHAEHQDYLRSQPSPLPH